MADKEDRAMTNTELTSRRFEARMMHRYGNNYMASIAPDGQFPTVMVGNPNQKIIIKL